MGAKWPHGWCIIPTRDPLQVRLVPIGLEPGDILLFGPEHPDRVQRTVVSVQRNLSPQQEHSAFTHVAIFLGDAYAISDSVIDVAPGTRVGVRSFADVSQFHVPGFVRARRVQMDKGEQDVVCRYALNQNGHQYSYTKIVRDLLNQLSPQWRKAMEEIQAATPLGGEPRKAYYCSDLVEAAFGSIGVSFLDEEVQAPMPWALSYAPLLTEVRISW